MRTIAAGTGSALKLTNDQRTRLKEFLVTDTRKALDGSFGLRNTWRQAIRSYQGDPIDEPDQRWRPFAGAPRIEISVAAEIQDTVVSQVEDLIFQVHPPLTVRARKGKYDDVAAAVQELVDHGVESGFWNFEQGVKRGTIDWAQLGTVIWYVPFTKTVRVTDVRTVVTMGPRISVVAPEHFILPAGADKDIQQAKFCTMRTFMSKNELKLRKAINHWVIDDAAGSDQDSMVAKDRKSAAGLGGGGYTENKIPVGQTWCYFDLKGDGVEADLKVSWNMLTGGIMKASYNDTNWRPFVLECYQDRGHVYAGVGVPEMVLGYEKAATEIINNHIWNMMIANTKAYTGPSEAMQEVTDIYPGKYMPNDTNQPVTPLDMGQVNASAVQAVSLILSMARERVGVQSLSAPIKSASRTPGISMLSMLQQANRRFTHPFNNMRNGAGQVVMQCLYRIQEEVLGGNTELMDKITTILGDDKAELVFNLMKQSEVELRDALNIQLIVSSVSVNRESDRQSLVQLTTQVIPLYWNAKKELAQFIAMPPFRGADKVAENANEVLDKLFVKVMKTFDQVSDSRAMIISLDDIRMAQQADQQMAQLQQGQSGPPQQGPPPQGPMGMPQ
jgi:hypothetical protein